MKSVLLFSRIYLFPDNEKECFQYYEDKVRTTTLYVMYSITILGYYLWLYDNRATDIRATDIRATDIRATDVRATGHKGD